MKPEGPPPNFWTYKFWLTFIIPMGVIWGLMAASKAGVKIWPF